MFQFPAPQPALLDDSISGTVSGLLVRPARRQPAVAVNTWDLCGAQDHARPGKRAVTLIQQEHIAIVSQLVEAPVDWIRLRRNVLVSGINLLTLLGQQFQVGTAVLEGTALCDPCKNMDEAIGPGGYAAMIGHGGICARILNASEIHIGDRVHRISTAP